MKDDSPFTNEDFWKDKTKIYFNRSKLKESPREVEKITSLLELDSSSKILDIGCGIGRISNRLAKRGHEVTGIDISKKHLKIAGRISKKMDVDVRYKKEDMRDYCRENYFDAAISIYTSFGYFKDESKDKKVLKNVYKSLKPGGAFLIELPGKECITRFMQNPKFRVRKKIESAIPGEIFRILCRLKLFFNSIRGRPTVSINLQIKKGWIQETFHTKINGEIEKMETSRRLYSAPELKNLMKEVGFTEIKSLGSLDKCPYDEKPRKLFMVGKKRDRSKSDETNNQELVV